MHRQRDRLTDRSEKFYRPLASVASEEAILVLNVDDVYRKGVDAGGGLAIGGEIILLEARDDARLIGVVEGRAVVDGNDIAMRSRVGVVALDQIAHKSCDSALPRRKRSDEKSASRAVHWAGDLLS